MFLKHMSDAEQMAFFELAEKIARADGYVRAEEARMIEAFRSEARPDVRGYLVQGLDIEEVTAAFTSDRAKRAALLDLVALMFADGVAHAKEHALLVEIQQLFGLDDATLERIFQWAQYLQALWLEGEALVGGESVAYEEAAG